MNGRKIIGLHGLPRVGKDTIASILVKERGFTRLAFADQLKFEICEAYGVGMEVFDNPALDKSAPASELTWMRCNEPRFLSHWLLTDEGEREWRETGYQNSMTAPRSPRWVMQRWGDWRRSQHRNYFINKVCRIIESMGSDIVVTDVRYLNELYELQYLGATMVCVTRPGSEATQHESDKALPGRDDWLHIANDGTLDELRNKVLDILATCR